MKNNLLFILLILILCSFTVLKTDKPNRVEDRYVGIWTEHWGNDLEGNKSSVDYVDTLKFELNSKGKLSMSCINYEYFLFSKIKPKESSLNFVVENTVDPNERFIIKYTLQRINEDLLEGKILNSRGKTVYISFKRLK